MSQTETSEVLEPEDRRALEPEHTPDTPTGGSGGAPPGLGTDPAVSPTDGHHVPEHTSPVPVVLHHTAPKPAPVTERTGTGVKLAKISKVGDQVFRGMAGGSGLLIVLLVVFVGVFLLALALPSLLRDQDNFLTSRNWVVAGNELRFGVAGLLWTTVLSSILAMVIAVPVAVGVALFLTQYLHKRASGPLSFVVDLLAAVPSIIFGLWGLTVLGPFLTPVGDWLIARLGFIPLFEAGVTVEELGLRRRRSAGDHGIADRHRDLPRRLRPDAA